MVYFHGAKMNDDAKATPTRQEMYDALHSDQPQVIKRYLKEQLYGEAGGRRELRHEMRRAPLQGGSTIRRSPKPLKPKDMSGRQFVKLRKQAQKIIRAN